MAEADRTPSGALSPPRLRAALAGWKTAREDLDQALSDLARLKARLDHLCEHIPNESPIWAEVNTCANPDHDIPPEVREI